MTEKAESSEFKLRVTPELRRQIEHAAKANGRTMNAEIVARLIWAFEHENEAPNAMARVLGVSSSGDVTDRRLSEIEDTLAKLAGDFRTHIEWHLANDVQD